MRSLFLLLLTYYAGQVICATVEINLTSYLAIIVVIKIFSLVL